jgi:O-methyltransferase
MQTITIRIPPDFDQTTVATLKRVMPFTMTSVERISSLCEAVKYVTTNNIAGDIVECGVWKGGSMMAAALTLQSLDDLSRELYLFDTFEGMPTPADNDVSYSGESGMGFTANLKPDGSGSDFCRATIDQVRDAVGSVGYPANKIHFVKGKVEDTVPHHAPDRIAILRLDTDWYESTRHELIHLYPRLVPRGVLIIDDYGHWQGARQAVDEYIRDNQVPLLLNRIDYTGRIAVKP